MPREIKHTQTRNTAAFLALHPQKALLPTLMSLGSCFVEWRMCEFRKGDALGWMGRLYSRRKVVCSAQLLMDHEHEERLWLGGLETEPQFRRQGYAQQLMGFLLAEFSDRYTELWLVVKPYGEGERMSANQLFDFYSKLGFEETTEFYRDRWVTMKRRL